MPMRVDIREVQPADVPALDILRRQAVEAACKETYDRESFVDIVAQTGDGLGDQVGVDGYHALLVETEVTPVSYGVLAEPGVDVGGDGGRGGSSGDGGTDDEDDGPSGDSGANGGETARLQALYTSPDHEGEGYATALLDRFVDRTRDRGGSAVRTVAPSATVGFFEARGFERETDDEWHGLPAASLVRQV